MWGRLQRAVTAAWLLWGALVAAAGAQGIYTCIDAKGQRLTSDRPIAECLDREQNELSASGALRRRIMPEPTPQQRVAEEDKARQALEEQNRQSEEKRRSRALLVRYPHSASHEQERVTVLARVDEAVAAAGRRIQQLMAQRRQLDTEAEFYKGDPARLPPKLKHQMEEADEQLAAQRRLIADQGNEKARINARFDEEAVRLKVLWNPAGTAAR